MTDVRFESHKDEVMAVFNVAKEAALESIGIVAEKYAKALCPVGTPESTGIPGYIGGTLRKSIGHSHDSDSAWIGSNVEYAPYQELGTMYMEAANGGKGYLKPAIVEHANIYARILRDTLKGYTL